MNYDAIEITAYTLTSWLLIGFLSWLISNYYRPVKSLRLSFVKTTMCGYLSLIEVLSAIRYVGVTNSDIIEILSLGNRLGKDHAIEITGNPLYLKLFKLSAKMSGIRLSNPMAIKEQP
jgi:hypothetical protein